MQCEALLILFWLLVVGVVVPGVLKHVVVAIIPDPPQAKPRRPAGSKARSQSRYRFDKNKSRRCRRDFRARTAPLQRLDLRETHAPRSGVRSIGRFNGAAKARRPIIGSRAPGEISCEPRCGLGSRSPMKKTARAVCLCLFISPFALSHAPAQKEPISSTGGRREGRRAAGGKRALFTGPVRHRSSGRLPRKPSPAATGRCTVRLTIPLRACSKAGQGVYGEKPKLRSGTVFVDRSNSVHSHSFPAGRKD